MRNRYNIIKSIYEDYLILIKKGNHYLTLDIDKLIMDKLNIKKIINLKQKHINYLILDNLQIIEKQEYQNNKYNEYYLKIRFINFIERLLINEEENNHN